MISIIICSVDEHRLANVSANIASTIGAEYEILAVDNIGSGKGICQVYNELADKAKYGYLCFIHEDVQVLTSDWGQILMDKAAESETGVIGFSGAAVKTKSLSGQMHGHYSESNVFEGKDGEPVDMGQRYDYSKSGLSPFAPVVTVDGLLQFMRKEVWAAVKYDQVTFPGFHLYDIDMATAVFARGYRNYVCHDVVKLVHFSRGNYTKEWYEGTVVYHQKWDDILPLYVARPSEERIIKDEQYVFFNITYHLMKRSNVEPIIIWQRVKYELKNHPLTFKSYYHLYRYLRYAKQYKIASK